MKPLQKIVIDFFFAVSTSLFIYQQLVVNSTHLVVAQSPPELELHGESLIYEQQKYVNTSSEISKQPLANDNNLEWEYEPRDWATALNSDDGAAAFYEDEEENFVTTLQDEQFVEQQQVEQNQEASISNKLRKQKPNDYHEEHYFGREQNLFKKFHHEDEESASAMASSSSDEEAKLYAAAADDEKCTQFRVDTREAVICDKKRCDKFDFEWPKYKNQLIMIQTSKDGMRFHQSNFAFTATANNKQQSENKKTLRYEAEPMSVSSYNPVHSFASASGSSARVKFDILDLFKPKPTTTPPPPPTASTTTTTPASSSTTQEPTTTAAPETTTTTTASTTTQAPSNGTTEAPAPERDHSSHTCDGHNPADNNSTRLITTLRLDTKRRKQKMVGFGGALSDSTCRNIKSLSVDMARSLMEDYYGDRGLRYNIARMSMGSSDFSTNPYTNNDKPAAAAAANETLVQRHFNLKRDEEGLASKMLLLLQQQQQTKNSVDQGDDVEMNNFHLTEEDYEFKLPIARQAIATSRQEVKFFSSLWSPPIWMKNNTNIVHGYLKGDVYGPYYKALAELMVKWLEAYKKNGIEFWATTGLNEPVTGVKPFIFHNSLGMTRDDYITFIKIHLGPLLKQRGFESVKLLLLDDNKGYAPNWVKQALEDKEAAKYISGVAFHWYMNDEYENLNFISKYHPDKFIIHTEACNGYLPFQVHALPGNWDRGVAYMLDIIKVIQKNAVGWVDWNMALDLTGGPSWINNNLDSAVIVNAKLDEYYKSPMFYAMGHFSRFVERDSIRLDYRLANARYDYPVEAVAFHTPKDYIVIVVLNSNRNEVPFKIIVDKQLVRIVTLRANSFNTIIFKWDCNDPNHHHSNE